MTRDPSVTARNFQGAAYCLWLCMLMGFGCQSVPAPAIPAAPSRTAYAQQGWQHLVRGEAREAIFLLRKAEAAPGDTPETDWLRLRQADALLALGETEAAMGILIGLIDSESCVDALARLGTLNLRAGRSGIGVQWLQQAADAVPIAKRPEIHHDLAVALLANGASEAGFTLLQQVRQILVEQEREAAAREVSNNERRWRAADTEALRAEDGTQ